ncbi:MAG: aldose epimerase family protein [Bacteroidota bacterium]
MVKVTKEKFGEFEGQEVLLFKMTNENGMTVKIMNYGATITSFQVPVAGQLREVACGFDQFESYFSEEYINNAPYFGCTVGRYCSQIKDAKFSLNGESFNLAANAGSNNLHGGKVGFDKKLWVATVVPNKYGEVVKMNLHSPDMEEGFPGNVDVSVTFILAEDNRLILQYAGATDKETPLSMTNHTYFNLSGFLHNIENHAVQINSKERLALDESGAATGEVLNLNGKPDDLRFRKKIKDVQEEIGDGFEHFYVFDDGEGELSPLASIKNQFRDLELQVHSNEPCMLFYTGKYTSDKLKRETGHQYGKFRAFCFETHRYQNGPNIEGSPRTTIKPGERFNSETQFRFITT